jgi:hypothetical protein
MSTWLKLMSAVLSALLSTEDLINLPLTKVSNAREYSSSSKNVELRW